MDVNAKLFLPGVGSRANGCLGFLATTSEPPKKPSCNGRFMSIRYGTQASEEVRRRRKMQLEDDSVWQLTVLVM